MSDLGKRLAKAIKDGKAKPQPGFNAKRPKIPDELAYLLLWYTEIRSAQSRGWRFEPVSYSEILAYRTLHQLDMTGWDVIILRRLDMVWQTAQPEPEKPKTA